MDGSQGFNESSRGERDELVNANSSRDLTLSDVDQANRRIELLEEKLLEARGQLSQSRSNNEKLTITIQQTRDQIAALRDEVEKLTQPPAVYGTFTGFNEDGSVDIFASGRKMRVALHPGLDPAQIARGDEVVLNESFTVIGVRDADGQGEVVTVKEVLDERRVLVYGRADEERVVELAEALRSVKLRSGDALLLDLRSNLLTEKLIRQEAEELILEEVPDISYADVGGLDAQIEAITDAVELPYLHRALFHDYDLPAPKGILLYGPPGCGKTLIAKAVANSLSQKVGELTGNRNVRSYFLNIKGPELLNKYVGETERQIRVVFQRYLHVDLPLDESTVRELGGGDRAKAVQLIIEETVSAMFRIDDENRFLEVTYQGGDKEILYFKDFASGAMIENIVRRAKKIAVKREIANQGRGLRKEDLFESIRQEFRENEDLPNTTNPDDWARISGKKGERIIFIRTLINREEDDEKGGRSIQHVGTGQYL